MAEEVERLRELLKETTEVCKRQASEIFDLLAENRTLRLRGHELCEENSSLKNKLEYYRNTVRAIRVPIEGEIS